jgi:hypothetical protein
VCLVAAAPGAGVPLEGILPRGAAPRQLQQVPRGLHVQLHQHKYIVERESGQSKLKLTSIVSVTTKSFERIRIQIRIRSGLYFCLTQRKQKSSVANPGCLSRTPGPKKLFLGSRILIIYPSRIPGSKRHRIRNTAKKAKKEKQISRFEELDVPYIS